jgi:hypothetical protein
MSASLNVTLAHAISYLTRPLIRAYPPTTIVKLRLLLEANLTALFAPTWVPKHPTRGSDHRRLTLSPKCLPPRAIYSACLATGVQWFDWIALLGGRQFDFFVDPACISVCFGPPGTSTVTVWSDEVSLSPSQFHANEPTRMQSQFLAQVEARAKVQSRTLAQQLVEVDKEEDEALFAMLADEISAPTWMTPIRDQFPVTARPSSPISAISAHSRSSSRSSNSSSGLSFGSSSDSYGSVNSGSLSPPSSSSAYPQASQCKQSRREKASQARVFVDASKTEVTPYDGGKTTVLTGGVMLGGPPASKNLPKPTRPTPTLRAVRA